MTHEKKTKIVATLGPSTADKAILEGHDGGWGQCI